MSKKTRTINFHEPSITRDEIDAVVEALESRWLTTGPRTRQFEADFAAFVGAEHAIAVNSCTAALHLALEAVGIDAGDEVLTTPMTFAATAEVIRYFQATPVFVDIEADTMNIDVARLEETLAARRAAGARVKAVLPVHYAGHPCEMEAILELARRHGLSVIEDAAHALPAAVDGKMIGCIGDITCFSFYATKTITTGEGGMITTGNDEFARRMRMMSLHGIDRDAWNRYALDSGWYYEIVAPGFKYNLTDIAASLGIVQLRRAGALRRRRESIAARYNQAFAAVPQLTLPAARENVRHSWHLYVLRLKGDALAVSRDRFIEELRARGIGTSVHFIPLHIHPYYQKKYGYKPNDFPVAHDNFQRMISLPIHPGMSDEDVDYVSEAVLEIAAAGSR